MTFASEADTFCCAWLCITSAIAPAREIKEKGLGSRIQSTLNLHARSRIRDENRSLRLGRKPTWADCTECQDGEANSRSRNTRPKEVPCPATLGHLDEHPHKVHARKNYCLPGLQGNGFDTLVDPRGEAEDVERPAESTHCIKRNSARACQGPGPKYEGFGEL